jgi:hypothetical protein
MLFSGHFSEESNPENRDESDEVKFRIGMAKSAMPSPALRETTYSFSSCQHFVVFFNCWSFRFDKTDTY